MRCPRCGFEGEPLKGGCARCGYGRMPTSASPSSASSSPLGRHIVVSNPVSLTAHALAPGEVLRQGRYRIIEQLSLPKNQQDQGTAWLAADARSPQGVVVLRELIPERGASSRLEQELRAAALRMAELGRYPGFPRLIDVFAEEGVYYFVFQHMDGTSLAQLVQERGPLPEYAVAEYGRQLCEVLNVLSSQQPPLVHGSISPDTVIISPDGKRASLIHLPLIASQQKSSSNGQRKTISGYLAPEQVQGDAGPASDLYGLAATLHHALTGYNPEEHMAFFYPPVRHLNSAVSSRMETILSHALRVNAAQRYARPAEMRKDLEAITTSSPAAGRLLDLASSSGHPMSTGIARTQRRRDNSGMLSMFAIVTVLISALLLGGIFLAIVRGPTSSNTQSNEPLLGTATARAVQTATALGKVQQQTAEQTEQLAESQSFIKQGIGVSDGRFVFDIYPGRVDIDLKKQAAQAIRGNDLDTAAGLFMKAVQADPIDAEAQIYNEDVHILQNNLPYVTIVLGLGFDSNLSALAVERANMQATFLAQYEINEFQSLPHHLQLFILIAGSGAGATNVATVAQFISNRVIKSGNPDHIIGVIGWPSSSQTLKARDILAASHIPLVSQTASDVKLAGSTPYFFRVNPPYDMQGSALATIAANQFQAKTVIVMRDPNDVYSGSLADAFIARLQALNVKVITNYSFSRAVTSVGDYETVVNAALANNVDVIFQPGSDVDAVRLAHAVGNALRAHSTNPVLARLKILGGSALDTNLLLGQGDGPDALLARNNPLDMQRLNFIALADPNEWTYLKVPLNEQPPFFIDWAGTFQNSVQDAENAGPPDQNAIMTYDALNALSRAAALVHGPLTGEAVRNVLASFGHGKVPAFQGVSGRIVFDDQGNPVDKALVLLDVESNGSGGNVIKVKQVVGTFLVSG